MERQPHLQAAGRHEAAAESHERLARLWHERGNSERASLERALADYERAGAKLERRWAELIAEENGGARERQPSRRSA
jgi:hypothetical protein